MFGRVQRSAGSEKVCGRWESFTHMHARMNRVSSKEGGGGRRESFPSPRVPTPLVKPPPPQTMNFLNVKSEFSTHQNP